MSEKGSVKNMKHIYKRLVSIVLVIVLVGCSSKQTNIDFWTATIQALDNVIEENKYRKGNWEIAVEDKARVDDVNQRSAKISQVFEEANVIKTATFSMQNRNDKKRISYLYKVSTTEQENRVDQTVTIISTDNTYKEYEILYTLEKYQSNIYQDSSQLKGSIKVAGNNTILSYETVPNLKEALEANLTLLTSFQKEFKIDYQNYDFVNLPAIAKDLEISEDDPQEALATTIDYYSEPYSNARGYMLMTFLKVDKDLSLANFGIYNTDGKRYESNATVTFEKRDMENCYNLIQEGDSDVKYAIYFDGETAYLYQPSTSDQQILAEIQGQDKDATYTILKTTNAGF